MQRRVNNPLFGSTVIGLRSRIGPVLAAHSARMARGMGKQILILAGPNGAGKTTFAREFLATEADCPTFLNADIIAADLSPQDPGRVALSAARFMLKRIEEETKKGEGFAWLSAFSRAGTTFPRKSFAAVFWLGGRISTTFRRAWSMPGFCTTIPGPSRSC